MTHNIKRNSSRAIALLLTLITVISLFSVPAWAYQVAGYHDPAEHWLSAANRTSEYDANAVITYGSGYCGICGKVAGYTAYRVPEYSTDGRSAMTRNIKYSDGTCVDGVSTGIILSGVPGVNAYYTGCHWTKTICDVCGSPNTFNMASYEYPYNKNIYWLYTCDSAFTQYLDETVIYAYADSNYHTVTTTGGDYCGFCYGTHHTESSVLERHDLERTILPQPGDQRYAVVDCCSLCGYEKVEYVTAKSVVANYYGVVDGQPHALTVSDLSDSGVRTEIRYGSSANACTLTSAPNYTEEGQYTVYYEIHYTYQNVSMTENGVAYVWLRDDSTNADGSCACGCGEPDCGCQDKTCNGSCTADKGCGDTHNFVLLDSVDPTCLTMGYDRYLCVDCGKIEKRDYAAPVGHAWQSVVVREADCETDGKTLNICINCGAVEVIYPPKGEHVYESYSVAATCTSPGYTVRECAVCGDRQITNITPVLAHNYVDVVTPATCETGGYTTHVCFGCGSAFVTDRTGSLGHTWDNGTLVTNATCTGEGLTEYRCVRCGYHRLEGNVAAGHVPGPEATCTDPQLCVNCGAVLANALGHSYETEVTAPTCTEMGYTTYTCTRCGDSYKGEYADATGHKASDWIIDKQPTTSAEGSRHKECVNCGMVLETGVLDKLYLSGTTDTTGKTTVGAYLVIVTDTDTSNPVANAAVVLNKGNSISVRLPDGRLLDYADQTTVTVLLAADNTFVEDLQIHVTDKNSNYCGDKTDTRGQITVPGTSGQTNDDGKATVGWTDADGDRWTLTVKVEDHETGRPIDGAAVTIGKTGTITIVLPDGVDMDTNHRIDVTVTDQRKQPVEDADIIVKGDLGQSASGKTDEKGQLTVPVTEIKAYHAAYVVGYPDGTFGPNLSMTRGEATAIFARLLAAHNGDRLMTTATTRFTDVPVDAWYAGSVKYLAAYGIATGYEDGTFLPNEPITRAEFTAMAVKFFDVYGDGNKELMSQYKGFNDVSDGDWAADYIADAAKYGWIVGYTDGSFKGDADITRAEVVTIVNRLLGRTADADYLSAYLPQLNTFIDLSGKRHWAYLDIMEAANSHTAVLGDDSESWSK